MKLPYRLVVSLVASARSLAVGIFHRAGVPDYIRARLQFSPIPYWGNGDRVRNPASCGAGVRPAPFKSEVSNA